MKNKGFTLIELLSVIVVLAIIALIAIPAITGIVNRTKRGSVEASAISYVDAVEKQKAINLLNEEESDDIEAGVYTAPLNQYNVTVKGQNPTKGWVEITKTGVDRYSLLIGEYTVTKDDSGIVTVTKGDNISSRPKEYPEYVYTNALKIFKIGNPVDGGIDLGEKSIAKMGDESLIAFDNALMCNYFISNYPGTTCSTENYITPDLAYLTKPSSTWEDYLKIKLDNRGNIVSVDVCDRVKCFSITDAQTSFNDAKSLLRTTYPTYTLESENDKYVYAYGPAGFTQIVLNYSVRTSTDINNQGCAVLTAGLAGCMDKDSYENILKSYVATP